MSFRLFGRRAASSTEKALSALEEYCAGRLSDVHREFVDVDSHRDLARSESVNVIPALDVKARGVRRRLTHGLYPLDVLKKQLDTLFSEARKGSKPPSKS